MLQKLLIQIVAIIVPEDAIVVKEHVSGNARMIALALVREHANVLVRLDATDIVPHRIIGSL